VLYVWFDAVLGYISGTQIWARNYYGDEIVMLIGGRTPIQIIMPLLERII